MCYIIVISCYIHHLHSYADHISIFCRIHRNYMIHDKCPIRAGDSPHRPLWRWGAPHASGDYPRFAMTVAYIGPLLMLKYDDYDDYDANMQGHRKRDILGVHIEDLLYMLRFVFGHFLPRWHVGSERSSNIDDSSAETRRDRQLRGPKRETCGCFKVGFNFNGLVMGNFQDSLWFLPPHSSGFPWFPTHFSRISRWGEISTCAQQIRHLVAGFTRRISIGLIIPK
jgi:hypothetical protein